MALIFKSSLFDAARYSSERKKDQHANSTFSVCQIQAYKVKVQRSDLEDKATKEPILWD